MTEPSTKVRTSFISIYVQLALSWLIPGLGFMLHGRKMRAAIHFVLTVVTFLIGISLHGGVIWPSWSLQSPDFNILNNIMFLIQMVAGFPAIISLIAQATGPISLAGIPQHPFFELGAYFLAVAGAVNYLAICNFYDRILGMKSHYEDQELGIEKDTDISDTSENQEVSKPLTLDKSAVDIKKGGAS